MPVAENLSRDSIPATLLRPGATQFWLAVLLTGIGTGLGAAALRCALAAPRSRPRGDGLFGRYGQLWIGTEKRACIDWSGHLAQRAV
jgi:hypothetical protein